MFATQDLVDFSIDFISQKVETLRKNANEAFFEIVEH